MHIFAYKSQNIVNMRSCNIYLNGTFCGVLTEQNAHLYTFTYDSDYLKSPSAVRICLAMPLTSRSYESPNLFPFFSNMLPEGSNRQFLCKDYHLAYDDDFGLLLNIATSDTIGAVTVKAR